jgi:orotate phosphoribosyltransferase
MDQTIAEAVARLLIQINAVDFRFDPPFTFTTGLKSPMYLDNRLVLSYPHVREFMVDYYTQAIETQIGRENIDWISGTASAAIPYASLVANELRLPMVYVRPTTKLYGKGNQMEGFLEKGKRVLIVEDHISTATSLIGNAEVIRKNGGIVTHCTATTTYELEVANKNFKEHKITPVVLTTGKIIAKVAFEQQHLSKKQRMLVEDWLKDSKGWGKRHGYE